MNEILLGAKIVKAARRVDGAISLTVLTVGEVSSEQFLDIDKSIGELGNFFFSQSPINPDQVPDYQPVENGDKTPAQRMRGTIYALYQHYPKKSSTTFDDYYRQVMEVFNENLKSRLPAPLF